MAYLELQVYQLLQRIQNLLSVQEFHRFVKQLLRKHTKQL
jgi:hypothetical protein